MAYSRGEVYCYYSETRKNDLPTFEICDNPVIQFTSKEITENYVGCLVLAITTLRFNLSQANILIDCMNEFLLDVSRGTVQGMPIE